MKKSKLALGLAAAAGLICVANFTYKAIRSNHIDYMILVAGIFIIGFGIASYSKKT
jgi:hypothetical protein